MCRVADIALLALTMAATLHGAQVQAVTQSTPRLHEIPPQVFELKVDGFKQVVGATIDCGALPGEIASIAPHPIPKNDAVFRFVAGERGLALEVDSNAKGRSRIVNAGGFRFDGPALTWTTNTFPEQGVQQGIKALREYLCTCCFVSTLTDWSTLLLHPPVRKVSGRAIPNAEGAIAGSIEIPGLTPETQLSIVSAAPIVWEGDATGVGSVRGLLSGAIFEIVGKVGVLEIRERLPVLEKLKSVRQRIASDRQLLPTLNPTQRELLQGELDASIREEADLAEKVKTEAGRPISTSLVVRAASSVTGRVIGEATIEIKR